MATRKIEYTEYICDCCKNKSRECNLMQVALPVEYVGRGVSAGRLQTAHFELCPDCFKGLFALLSTKYKLEYPDYGEVRMEVRDEEA